MTKYHDNFTKQLEKNPIKFSILNGIGITIAGLILFPLIDWIIKGQDFAYSIQDHLIEPIIIGIVCAIIYIIIGLNKTKKKSSKKSKS